MSNFISLKEPIIERGEVQRRLKKAMNTYTSDWRIPPRCCWREKQTWWLGELLDVHHIFLFCMTLKTSLGLYRTLTFKADNRHIFFQIELDIIILIWPIAKSRGFLWGSPLQGGRGRGGGGAESDMRKSYCVSWKASTGLKNGVWLWKWFFFSEY